MVNVKINGLTVNTVDEIVYTRNRKSMTDFGSMTVVNTRELRYEPYSKVLINNEQYLVESDNPIALRSGNWEHHITLVENIAIFSTIFPVDRQFTTVPGKTIGEILATYKRELEFYQSFLFDFDDTDTIYDTKMVNKRYEGVDFAVIVYDLFRKIDAIPRITYTAGRWYLTYELYTDRNTEISLSTERHQNKVNDIDYATEVLSKGRNVISESKGVWCPSKSAYITPRSKSTMLKTSDWQFELDSNINTIYQAIALVECTYNYNSGGSVAEGEVSLLVDFTNGIRLKDEYETLPISEVAGGIPAETLLLTERPSYKQNNVYYEVGKNVIEGLYWKKDNVIFDSDIEAIYILINSYMNAAARAQLGEGADNYIDGTITPKSGELDLENIKCKFYYRAERNIDFVLEKRDITRFNKSTVLNQQKDNSVELARFMENQSAFVERIGNNIYNITQSFANFTGIWVLGDYFTDGNDYWPITDIKYTVHKTIVQVVAEFNKNFSNTNRESGITREPTAFIYTGRSLQSNYIYREYLTFSKTALGESNSILSENGRRIVLNLLDYDSDYNKMITNATYRRAGSNIYIDMPIYSEGSGNSIILHGHFNDARVAGYGLQKLSSAWYKKPIYYTDDDFEVDMAEIRFNNATTHLTDTDELKYYPQVNSSLAIPFTNATIPLDKDPNDIFALTYELIVCVTDNEIVVPNGFARLNNLITDYDSTPTVKIYENTEPYTIFDKTVKGTEITGSITLDTDFFEVADEFNDLIPYWCIGIDDEIVLAGNGIKKIYYSFTQNRMILSVDEIYYVSASMNLELALDATVRKYFSTHDVSMELELELNATVNKVNIINRGAYMNIQLTFVAVTEKGYKAFEESDVDYYNSASTKVTRYVDTTLSPKPSITSLTLATAMRLYVYNMQSSSSGEYGIAGTQIDIGDPEAEAPVVTGASDTETVESFLEIISPANYAIFIAGNMTDTVIKITDQNLTVTYWKPNYILDGYYKVVFENY
jgi:hypothetical protein